MTMPATRAEPTPDQRARWDRRKAAFHALSKIDAAHALALVQWLVPVARDAVVLPINDDDWDKELSQIDLLEAIEEAEDYLLVQQRWNSLRAQHSGKTILTRLANTLAKHIGRQTQLSWESNDLYLLSEVLP